MQSDVQVTEILNHESMQASVPIAEAPVATFQLASRTR